MRVGEVIDGRFEIQELAGSGGMGEVFRALDRVSGEVVAVKTLLGDTARDRARFDREAHTLAELQHPGIVRYLAHGLAQDGKPYLAMEWIEGESLARRLARGKLSIEDSVTIAMAVAQALSPAHARGIVHRDLKPSNMVLFGGDPLQVKVLDFGIAWLDERTRLTRTGLLVGTPGYMSPEQARCAATLDARADVFSLGCVLYECVTGTRAFDGEHVMALLAKVLFGQVPPVSKLRVDVPPALDRLVSRMLAKDPANRPADGAAVAQALAKLDAGEDEVRMDELPHAPVSALTQDERRLFSVVLIASPRPAKVPVTQSGTETSSTIGRRVNPVALVVLEEPAERSKAAEDALRCEAEASGGRFEQLADGSAVITIAAAGIATDQVAQAARCALAVCALEASCPVALVTGRSEAAGAVASEVIDRAAKLLEPCRASRTEFASSAQSPAWPPVVIDEVTAGMLEPRFEVVKGRWGVAILGERPQFVEAHMLLGKPVPCVGRERELAGLAEIFSECAEEQAAAAVVVTAPAGVGKSRLVQEFLRALSRREQPVQIWIGKGDALRSGSAFAALGQAIRGACGIRDDEPLAAAQDKIRARVARAVAGTDPPSVVELIGELAHVPFRDNDGGSLAVAGPSKPLLIEQMRRAWEDWLKAECAHPVVLVLEDLHWVDRSTVRFVDAALCHLKRQPLLVIALGRPEVHAVHPRLWAERSPHEIRLRPLKPKASAQLVHHALGDRVSPAEVERIVALSDGHALYLEELIRAVFEGRSARLPETVVWMVQARLEGLEPQARRLLRAASIFGEVFWRGAVACLLGSECNAAVAPATGDDSWSSPFQLDHWLGWLVEHELLVRRPESRFAGEVEYGFRHELFREGAYAMLTDGDRALGHRLAARWLEQSALLEARRMSTPVEQEAERAWAARFNEQIDSVDLREANALLKDLS